VISDTIFEYKIFLIIFLVGIIVGALYGVLKMVLYIFKNNLILQNILEFLFAIFFVAALFFALNLYNFGQFRLYLLFSYGLGFFMERITVGKLFAKIFLYVYNCSIKLLKKLYGSKLIKFVLK
jgi:hypothetical protein